MEVSSDSDEEDDDIVELTGTSEPQQVVTMQEVDEIDWGVHYANCPIFGKIWNDMQNSGEIWPEKVKLY